MGSKSITLKLPTDYTDNQLFDKIKREIKSNNFTYFIEKKSLDARKKSNPYWQLRVSVESKNLKGKTPEQLNPLEIKYTKRNRKIVVVGSGPAGFFSSFILQKAGFDVTLIERGADVDQRSEGIEHFEKTSIFNPTCNYAFGEGGAGTFSDGKLTSRTKNISREKQFILSSYIKAGAPDEIAYLSHPHLGSDNLKNIVKNLRLQFIKNGGKVLFKTLINDLVIRNNKVISAISDKNTFSADEFIFAPGHSSYETYRMLINQGIKFRTKNFAIGCRVEHPQKLINEAQWGCSTLNGVKAAEYRLTSSDKSILPVYTFCMCPGGTIVPATPYKNCNIVNGMSLYKRDSQFANAACVAGVNLDQLTGKQNNPLDALIWLENIEKSFYNFSHGYKAPFCTIKDFINKTETLSIHESSYQMGLTQAKLWNLLPDDISNSIRSGLINFNHKLHGFDSGIILGLESKTSSPIQVIREKTMNCTGFDNLFITGEGSGYSGGIISSAVDGIKSASSIINKYN